MSNSNRLSVDTAYHSDTDKSINWLHAHATPLGKFLDNLESESPYLPEDEPNPIQSSPHPADAFFKRPPAEQERSRRRRNRIGSAVFRDLESGDLQSYGCVEGANGLPVPQEIPPSLWIKARTYYNYDVVKLGSFEFTDVRVRPNAGRSIVADVPSSTALPPSPDVPQQTKRKPGRPSEGTKIRTAIENCAAPADFFEAFGPDDRLKQYRAKIKAMFGIDTLKVPKFDEKTLKKYETEFRAKIGR